MLVLQPRDKRVSRTQEEHLAYYKSINQDMISMIDTLELRNDTDAMKEIRSDWKGFNWEVTSTRIDYKKNTITHNVGSKREVTIKLKEIPYCDPTYLPELLSTNSGLNYVRALCNKMKASKEELTKMLEELSTKEAKNIRFWTPSQESRNSNPTRAVRLYFYGDDFNVGGNVWFDNYDGSSHGVRVESGRSPAKIKLPKFTQEEIRKSCEGNGIAMIEYNKRYHNDLLHRRMY